MAYQLHLENFARSDWEALTQPGDVGDYAEALVSQYRDQFDAIPLANVRDHLREYGAWDDLEEAGADTLYQRLAFANAPTMLDDGMIWID